MTSIKTVVLVFVMVFMCGAPHESHASMALGLQGGYAHGQARSTADYESMVGHANIQKGNFGFNGALGGVFLGYDFSMNEKVLLGVEGNFFFSSIQGKATQMIAAGVNDTISQKLKSSFDLLVKLGYRLNPLVTYVKFGPCYGRWAFKSTMSDATPDFSKTKNVLGIKFALGIEGKLNEKIGWGLEYNHSFFKTQTVKRVFDPTDAPTPHKIRPNYGALLVRVMYKT